MVLLAILAAVTALPQGNAATATGTRAQARVMAMIVSGVAVRGPLVSGSDVPAALPTSHPRTCDTPNTGCRLIVYDLP